MADRSSGAAKVPAWRFSILVMLLVVVGVGISYYFYVEGRIEYYTSRNVRLLASMANQVAEAIETNRNFVRNFATYENFKGDLDRSAVTGDAAAIADLYFPGLSLVRRPCESLTMPSINGAFDTFAEDVVIINGKPWLRIGYHATSPKALDVCGMIRLEDALNQSFRTTMMEPFDSIILSDAAGRVFYQSEPSQRNLAPAFSVARSAHDAAYRRDAYHASPLAIRLASLTALEENKGWRDSAPLSLRTLGVTHKSEVNFAGETFLLFGQPCNIALKAPPLPKFEEAANTKKAEAKPDADKTDLAPNAATADQWFLCAIVSRSRARYEAMAISGTIVALATGVLLLLAAFWPFLRIGFGSERRSITVADVIFLGFGTLIAIAVVTIIVCDTIVYRRLESIADLQMRRYAVVLEGWFRSDIKRALDVIDVLEKKTDPDTKKNRGGLERDEDLIREPAIQIFSYFSTFAWLDKDGEQVFKESVKYPIPKVSSKGRDYFARALNDNGWWISPDASRKEQWTVPGTGQPWVPRRFALESIRSRSTGQPEAVIAHHTGNEKYPVLALTMSLSQLIHPIVPAGLTFAVIDDGGQVLFHSDPNRNGIENFFDESDHNRQLRSSIVAHHSDIVDLHYGGEDYRALVSPMEAPPWTLIVLRHQRLPRTVNTEIIVMTLMCLSLFIGFCLVVIGIAALVMPRYRLPWLWPDASRARAYVRAIASLCCLILASAGALLLFESSWLLLLSFVIPLHALVTMYLTLQTWNRATFFGAFAAWLLLTYLWLHMLLDAPSGSLVSFWAYVDIARTIIALLLACSALLSLRPLRPDASRFRFGTYVTAALLLLVVVAVVPTVGFFKTAYDLEIRSFIRYGQLQLAEQAQHRVEKIAEAGFRSVLSIGTRLPMPAFFDSWWWLQPENPALPLPSAYRCDPPQRGVPRARKATELAGATSVPDWLEDMLPQYSEDSVPMRELHHDESSDSRWWSCTNGPIAIIGRNITLDRKAITNDSGKPKILDIGEKQTILVGSFLPSILPRWLRREPLVRPLYRRDLIPFEVDLPPHSDPGFVAIARGSAYLLGLSAAMFIALWMVRFIARTVFLADVLEPLWLGQRLQPAIGEHLFVIRQPTTTIDTLIDKTGFHIIKLGMLKTAADWRNAITTVDQLTSNWNVVIEDVELVCESPLVSRDAVVLIEHLLRIPRSMTVLFSTIGPLDMMSDAQPGLSPSALRDRWSAVLGNFFWISEVQLTRHMNKALPAAEPAPWISWSDALNDGIAKVLDWWQWLTAQRIDPVELCLRQEAGSDPLLCAIAAELRSRGVGSREQVLDEFRERAASYYAVLWSSCSADEKLLLFQVARTGLLNGKNRRMVRRLLGRGIVRREPALKLINESYRQYVIAVGVREGIDVQQKEEEDNSLWARISKPLALALIVIAVMFFSTQKDLLNSTSAVVTALAGGVPALIKLIGMLTDRRSESAAG